MTFTANQMISVTSTDARRDGYTSYVGQFLRIKFDRFVEVVTPYGQVATVDVNKAIIRVSA